MKVFSADPDNHAPWDQLPDEPKGSYVRFLIYRNLGPVGPGRSLDRAYRSLPRRKGVEGRQLAPGLWSRECQKYRWVERSHEWDVYNISERGQETVVLFVAAIRGMAIKLIEAIEKDSISPGSWEELHEGLTVLGQFVPATVVDKIREKGEAKFAGQRRQQG
jgi:hypothetical protein